MFEIRAGLADASLREMELAQRRIRDQRRRIDRDGMLQVRLSGRDVAAGPRQCRRHHQQVGITRDGGDPGGDPRARLADPAGGDIERVEPGQRIEIGWVEFERPRELASAGGLLFLLGKEHAGGRMDGGRIGRRVEQAVQLRLRSTGIAEREQGTDEDQTGGAVVRVFREHLIGQPARFG